MKLERAKDHSLVVILVILFLCLSAGVILLAWRSHQNYYQQFQTETNAQLAAIAELKANEIGLWYHERWADAEIFYHNELFTALAAQYLADPDDTNAAEQLEQWLNQHIAAYQYAQILLIDQDGLIRAAAPDPTNVRQWRHYEEISFLPDGSLPQNIFRIDWHKNNAGEANHLSLVIPLFDVDQETPIGLLVLQINPNTYLYPTLAEMPVLGNMGEMLLLRREGNELLLLNNPDPNELTALSLRLPIGETACAIEPPEVGRTVVASGVDYKGRPAVAASRRIPQPDWVLVACAQQEALYAPLQERGLLMAELAGLIILFLATGGTLVWRWQRGRFFQQKYESEQALRAAEAQAQAEADLLRNLAHHAPGVLFQYRRFPDGRSHFPYASEGVNAIYEVTPEQVREDAAPIFARLHPDDYERVMASIATSFDSGEPWHDEHRALLPQRGERWLEGQATPQRLTDGSVLWHGFITDVTERKETEARLNQILTQFLTAEAIAHIGTWEMDIATGDCVWSDEFCRICGLEPGVKNPTTAMGMEIIHPDDRERAAAAVELALNETGLYNIEKRIVQPDGRVRHVRSIGQVTQDKAGNPAKLTGAFLDVTDSKEAEQVIKESEKRYRRLFESAHDAILIADDQGCYLDANPAACSLLGYSRDELLGLCGDQVIAHQGEAEEKWEQFVEEGQQYGEIALRRKDGEIVYAEYRAATNFLPGRHFSVLRDITERKQYERTLGETRKQLIQQERLAAVGQLSAGIAHDFNNILAVILLYAQMMQRSTALPVWEREAVDTIEKQTKNAARLVQQILDFSRRSMLERVNMDLLSLVKEQVKLLERTFPENIIVNFQVKQTDSYIVHGDAGRLQQIILNLAVNARDAMPQGGELTIELEKLSLTDRRGALTPGNWAALRIKDNGEGIPAEAQPYILEPFFTTKEPGKGSGLGLAQAQGIVAQHDGHISFESAVNQGATFTIYLPISAEMGQTEPRSNGQSQLGQGETILLVEDDDMVRMALTAGLEQLNYQIIAAANGQIALDLLLRREQTVNAIVSDMIMPGMGGAELFREIRKQGWQLPMVIVTGHHLDAQLDKLTSDGLAGWLNKPVSLDQLAELLHRILHESQQANGPAR